MRLIRFATDGATASLGVHKPDSGVVVDLETIGDELDVGLSETMPELLAEPRWREKLDLLVTHAAETGAGERDAETVELLAPIESPGKIICVGLNYIEHVEEGGQERPENPILFSKFTNAITGPDSEIAWDPELTAEVDYEAELALVVGDRTRRVAPEEATDHLAGYTVANDVSARDLQFADDQWVRGKSLDGFCPLGPSIVTEDELDDPEACSIWTEVNGERLQDSSTSNLIFDIDTLVSFCSDAFTLEPGDVILTGTPPGVGAFREPPIYLQDSDTVEVGIEGIGTLTNHCGHD
ncbi:fumarylacetoacetate hydrolase family protein [Halorubrum kocurii]|uniref:5-carboxymethyl-2-hydroxymuconate delta-isomerase n=1 Tax=Halorubrum kocurii JCM 14978 TaxID=1230456 RepID=M0PJ53_9EURY|nr:fumarylacetoacetate hydrolase family protein [Halorubrum kocurii]EMA70052.1 5-carboxymethyl-2-hydroxymuconate delta-isomerase [Halorubrum kocurii JCM 14978]